jgi:hypothetical protein
MKKQIIAAFAAVAVILQSAIVITEADSIFCSMREKYSQIYLEFNEIHGEPSYNPPANAAALHEEIHRAVNRYSRTGRMLLPAAAYNMSKTVHEFIDTFSFFGQPFFTNTQLVGHYYYHMSNMPFFDTDSMGPATLHMVDNWLEKVAETGSNIISTQTAAERIPANLRTFRFDDYVSQGAAASSNTRGIYGLMYELGAYYYDLTLTLDLVDYALTFFDRHGFAIENNNPSHEMFRGYINALVNSTQAFYEFVFWTLEYMLFLRQNHREHFDTLMNNEGLRKTFAFFYLSGEHIINNIEPVRTGLVFGKMRNLGVTVDAAENEITLITTAGNRQSSSKFEFDNLAEAKMLKNEIATPRLTAILQEMLNGYEDTADFSDFIICGNCEHCRVSTATISRKLGDVTGTGSVTINDAVEILRFLAGMSNIIENDSAALNAARITNPGSGEPTINDVVEILRYLAGMSNKITGNQH